MRAWLGSTGALALVACAPGAAVISETWAPGFAERAPDFVIETPTDDAARVATPEVVRRLEAFGFRQGPQPALLVSVTASQRQRNVGAYSPSACGSAWVVDPTRKWLIGGGQTMVLQIVISDIKTGKALYRSSAYKRTRAGSIASSSVELAAAALLIDPRRSAPKVSPCGH